jgi:hypothetical protein
MPGGRNPAMGAYGVSLSSFRGGPAIPAMFRAAAAASRYHTCLVCRW